MKKVIIGLVIVIVSGLFIWWMMHSKSTRNNFVQVLPRTDTVAVTFEYEGKDSSVLYQKGHIVRSGLFVPPYKDDKGNVVGGWQSSTDHIYTHNWKLFSGTVLRLSVDQPAVDTTNKKDSSTDITP